MKLDENVDRVHFLPKDQLYPTNPITACGLPEDAVFMCFYLDIESFCEVIVRAGGSRSIPCKRCLKTKVYKKELEVINLQKFGELDF